MDEKLTTVSIKSEKRSIVWSDQICVDIASFAIFVSILFHNIFKSVFFFLLSSRYPGCFIVHWPRLRPRLRLLSFTGVYNENDECKRNGSTQIECVCFSKRKKNTRRHARTLARLLVHTQILYSMKSESFFTVHQPTICENELQMNTTHS